LYGSLFWNKGIITEVVGVVIDFLFAEIGTNRITVHDIQNITSGIVMQKNGMLLDGILREHSIRKGETFGDLVCYAILRKEWVSKHSNRKYYLTIYIYL